MGRRFSESGRKALRRGLGAYGPWPDTAQYARLHSSMVLGGRKLSRRARSMDGTAQGGTRPVSLESALRWTNGLSPKKPWRNEEEADFVRSLDLLVETISITEKERCYADRRDSSRDSVASHGRFNFFFAGTDERGTFNHRVFSISLYPRVNPGIVHLERGLLEDSRCWRIPYRH